MVAGSSLIRTYACLTNRACSLLATRQRIPSGPGSLVTCPQLAQVAMQSGRHAARPTIAQIAGDPMTPFRYRDKGIMATVGRRAAIAQLGRGFILRGTLGWAAWFALHLAYLVGFRNKLTVFINWTWRYLSWKSGPRIIVGDEPHHLHGAPPTNSHLRAHRRTTRVLDGRNQPSEV
jgi:hypothetical protein